MEKGNRMDQVRGGCGVLCHGRLPFAFAEIEGKGDYSEAQGGVALYATPAGVVVSVRMSGLPRGAVWRLCLERGSGAGEEFSCFPLLYEREGEAWCAHLTGKLSCGELVGGLIRMTVSDGGGRKTERTVAAGTLLPWRGARESS